MNEETQVITTEYLRKIETALNMMNGEAFTPKDRLEFILEKIRTISHRAGYVNNEYTRILRNLSDYLDVIEIDFSKFPDDEEEYRKGWEEWKESFYRRPSMRSIPEKESR